MVRSAKRSKKKQVEAFRHDGDTRKNIPPAEYQSMVRDDEKTPIQVAYEQRNTDLDPQLVWRGKGVLGASDLTVDAPPIYIQEKVQSKALVDDLMRQTDELRKSEEHQPDMFSDFNGIPDEAAKTEFYQHDANWTNRMILGDSLQVMASLGEREGLKGKIQCIYLDPPYGIKFNSNFQWSTTSNEVRDGVLSHITREPEQVRAFRDTWQDGVHTYLSYLRDRLIAARELLTETGSIFVQIGDANVHYLRSLLDEVFGDSSFVTQFFVQKTTGAGSSSKLMAPPEVGDYVLWFAKNGKSTVKYRELFKQKIFGGEGSTGYKNIQMNDLNRTTLAEYKKNHGRGFEISDTSSIGRVYHLDNLSSQSGSAKSRFPIDYEGQSHTLNRGSWKSSINGIQRLKNSYRLGSSSSGKIGYIRFWNDFPVMPIVNVWTDTVGQNQFGHMGKRYVVQTAEKIVQRCMLMATDPGDLVLDPTCGSGTTAYVAEQWGRRWITIDTSRVALAIARSRIMGARYPYYIKNDSKDGQAKQAELSRSEPSTQPTFGDVRQGFVYQRVPHVTLRSIAQNIEIDVIWETFQAKLETLREQLNSTLDESWEEWEIPREADDSWSAEARQAHAMWWEQRIARQKEIDASIAAKADFEYLYDKPYEDNTKVRVAGPFTVETLSPHRVLTVDENEDLIDGVSDTASDRTDEQEFVRKILENLKTAGVQQAHKEDKINFVDVTPFPGHMIGAEGRYYEGEDEETADEKRAAIFIGPEFGTVSRPDLVEAAREAADAGFDSLVACAFNYDARSTEFDQLGRIPVLKARMNADLHMADDLKNTGKGNLFVIFGEPDIDILEADDDMVKVKVNGVDVFDPNSGEVRSDSTDGIACWFIDTDYNEESFFVRHAYFLGANDPYKALKTTLKAEIDEEAWESLHSDTSRPFGKPESGRVAVKVINHLGDEVMKVFRL
jgi:adenine-specific DNA-methyltransferase